MAKRGKRDTRGKLQRVLDAESAATEQAAPVNNFTEQHGDYERNVRSVRNRSVTTVQRWHTAQPLSEGQLAAIDYCERLWDRVGLPSTTANLQREVRGSGAWEEADTVRRADARRKLIDIAKYVPHSYWSIFERVVRFNEVAGKAGAELSTVPRTAQDRARMVVTTVADFIAKNEGLVCEQKAA